MMSAAVWVILALLVVTVVATLVNLYDKLDGLEQRLASFEAAGRVRDTPPPAAGPSLR
jgi:hypothetical protein